MNVEVKVTLSAWGMQVKFHFSVRSVLFIEQFLPLVITQVDMNYN